MSSTDILTALLRLLESRQAASFFVNSPPGAGSSYWLKQLTTQLPKHVPTACVLGPYAVAAKDVTCLNTHILQDCDIRGFLSGEGIDDPSLSQLEVWDWIREHGKMRYGQPFVVLLDATLITATDVSTSARLFSDIRKLEGHWGHPGLRVFYLVAGQWDHKNLESYFTSVSTSFPYTVSDNYARWQGMSLTEMTTMVHDMRPDSETVINGRLLHELTGGHARAALDILERTSSREPLTLSALLVAARLAAASGPAAQALVNRWRGLSDRARVALKTLVIRRFIRVKSADTWMPLLDAGIARRDANVHYLSFASWYIELVVRLRLQELGIADAQTNTIRLDQLMPSVTELNAEAYRVVNEIENLARGFAATCLSLSQEPDEAILDGQFVKRNKRTVDLAKAAKKERERGGDAPAIDAYNPDLSYISTDDLAKLIGELGIKLGSDVWVDIGAAIEQLKPVRNAVMHNRLIDFSSLQRLYDLRAKICATLDEAL